MTASHVRAEAPEAPSSSPCPPSTTTASTRYFSAWVRTVSERKRRRGRVFGEHPSERRLRGRRRCRGWRRRRGGHGRRAGCGLRSGRGRQGGRVRKLEQQCGCGSGRGRAHVGLGPRWKLPQIHADETPELSEASDASDPDDVSLPRMEGEIVSESEVGHAPTRICQTAVSTSELRLPVSQFKDHIADLTLDACTVGHDLTQASITDLLQLSSTGPRYRNPYLMERFVDVSVNWRRAPSIAAPTAPWRSLTYARSRQRATRVAQRGTKPTEIQPRRSSTGR